MIILPNSYERYLSALRIFTSLSILKHGLKPRHLKNLRKIYIAEAIYNKNSIQSVNISKLSNNLLTAVKLINPNFKYKTRLKGNFYINKALYSLFLLSVSKISNSIEIEYKNDCVCILFEAIKRKHIPYLQELDGYTLRFKNKTLALIPSSTSNADTVYIESAWEYIFDKFSIINIF